MSKKLTKSSTHKALYGVCGGIAEYVDVSPFIVRVVFLISSGISFWVYLFLVWYLDDAPSL